MIGSLAVTYVISLTASLLEQWVGRNNISNFACIWDRWSLAECTFHEALTVCMFVDTMQCTPKWWSIVMASSDLRTCPMWSERYCERVNIMCVILRYLLNTTWTNRYHWSCFHSRRYFIRWKSSTIDILYYSEIVRAFPTLKRLERVRFLCGDDNLGPLLLTWFNLNPSMVTKHFSKRGYWN